MIALCRASARRVARRAFDMRELEITEGTRTPSKAQLHRLAQEFVEQGVASEVMPSWMNNDGTYNWRDAANAQMSAMEVPHTALLLHKLDRALMKIHYAIWLEYENERLRRRVCRIEQRRADLRAARAALSKKD